MYCSYIPELCLLAKHAIGGDHDAKHPVVLERFTAESGRTMVPCANQPVFDLSVLVNEWKDIGCRKQQEYLEPGFRVYPDT